MTVAFVASIITTGAYLQPGYDESSLMAGSVHILTSYGNALMETVCKDACSGHDVDKVNVISLKNKVRSCKTSAAIISYHRTIVYGICHDCYNY